MSATDADLREQDAANEEQSRPDAAPSKPSRSAPSFAKGIFLGEFHEELINPYPKMRDEEAARVAGLVEQLKSWAIDRYDVRDVEEQRWIGDDRIRELGEMGMLGLYVDPAYGGLGLSQTGYCRVSEEFGRIDATLAVIMGVHQSIGYKGIHLYGTDEQKGRFLPDLAAGRKLAGFALTEPGTGSDAYNLEIGRAHV